VVAIDWSVENLKGEGKGESSWEQVRSLQGNEGD